MFGLQCHKALKAYTLQGVGRHVRAQLVHRSQVWPLAGGWLEDHEVEGAPRVVKDITTTLSEQSENISVLQRTAVADAHGGIFSKRFSGGGSFVMFRGGVPVGRERSQLSHFRVIEVLVDVVAVRVAVRAVVITTTIIAAVIVAPTIVAATIIAAAIVVVVQRMHVLDDFAQLAPCLSGV